MESVSMKLQILLRSICFVAQATFKLFVFIMESINVNMKGPFLAKCFAAKLTQVWLQFFMDIFNMFLEICSFKSFIAKATLEFHFQFCFSIQLVDKITIFHKEIPSSTKPNFIKCLYFFLIKHLNLINQSFFLCLVIIQGCLFDE